MLSALDLEDSDRFGRSISIDGDYVVVGAYLEDPNGVINGGSAYVFKNDGADSYNQVAKLIAEDVGVGDMAGVSVDIDSDYVVVGVSQEDPNGVNNGGSAYLFKNDGTDNYSQIAKINASNTESGDYFGKAVGISGNDIVVGANSAQPTSLPDAGSAYIFTIVP
jgi:hypothetical protein